MPPTLAGNVAEQLEPGIRHFVGAGYTEARSYYADMVRVSDSDKAAEHILEHNYFSIPGQKPEGAPMASDTYIEGRKKNITHATYALAVEYSWEALSDEKYGNLKDSSRELGKSMKELIEIRGHLPYTDGFSNELAIDTLSVFNTAHVNLKLGTTWSNRAATDLSYAAMQQVITDFMNLTDGTGKHIALMPDKMFIPPESWIIADQIFGSKLEPFTADNTKNVMTGKFTYETDPYIPDTDSWFVRAPMNDIDAHFFFREKPMQDSWDDKKSRISAFAIIARFGYGTGDAHGLYGSPGA